MPLDVDALLAPPTPVAARALDALVRTSPRPLVRHCLRSWAWATLLAPTIGLEPDRELLFVAAMLHDLGVVAEFDAHAVPFEDAGGAVAAVFAIGAGWDDTRATRVTEVVQRHMWTSVEPAEDPEGHLLEVATSLDVSGVGFERWDAADLRAVARRLPRDDFSATFAAAVHEQASRKPTSAAARLDGSGRVRSGGDLWDAFVASDATP